MAYCRSPADDWADMHASLARDARLHPDPWGEAAPDPAPSAADLGEIAALEEALAELTSEIGAMSLSRDPDLGRWQQMAADAERELERARGMGRG